MMGEESGTNFKNSDYINQEDNLQNEPQRISINGLVFEKADYEKALEQIQKQSNQMYKNQSVSAFVKMDHFKIYGTGIYMFFNFTWALSMVFLIFSILSIIPMVFNYLNGNAFQNTINNLELSITKLSIGSYSFDLMMDEDDSTPLSLNYKHLNVFVDFTCSVIFFIFYFYWEKRSKDIQKEIYRVLSLPSSSTVEIVEFPECADETVIGEFMGRFGTVVETAAVRDYQDKIFYSKKIYDTEISIKQLQALHQKKPSEKLTQKISQKQQQIHELYRKLNSSEQAKQSQYIKFYVTYQNQQERNQVIKKFESFQKLCSCCESIPEECMINQEKVVVERCLIQPGGIIWENAHITWKTRWIRMLIQLLLILVIVAGGFLFISFLNILTPDDNSQGVDTSNVTADNIASVTDEVVKRVWCINNISTYYDDETISGICYNYWRRYIIGILITIGISLAVVVFKLIVKIIVIGLAKFQRYQTHTEQSVTLMTNLLITYISTTVLITFLMQANVFGLSFKNALLYVISDESILANLINLRQYSDLTHEWYLDIGYQIWFNSLILAFIPHFIMPIVHSLLQCISRCFARREIFQKNMIKKLQKPDFQIQDHYANIMMIMIIGLFFGGPMPAIVPISFVGIITRYVYFKIAFIKYSRVPKSYNQALNERVKAIMKAALIIKCIYATWVFGVSDIFVHELSIFTFSTQFVVVEQFVLLLQRIFITWYYSLLSILFILVFILRDTLIEFFISICKNNTNKEQQQKKPPRKRQSISISPMQLVQHENTDEIKQTTLFTLISQRSLTKSYKIQNNPDYNQILAIMHLNQLKRLHGTHISK